MDKAVYDKGLEVRRSVLGREHVDRALARADDFDGPLQDLVTEYCWGAVWGRPGLDRKTHADGAQPQPRVQAARPRRPQ